MDSIRNTFEKIKFEPSFFMDEEREKFFVSSMTKRYWAGQLAILSEIDRICQKYDIKWFADNGTLLGAIRHGGYIPWDDDLDICMLRSGYDLFFSVAKKELPEQYRILDVKYEIEYDNMIGRIVNSQSAKYDDAYLYISYGCPYTVGVDIFPLDDLSTDEDLERDRRKKLLDIQTIRNMIENNQTNTIEYNRLLTEIERQNNVVLRKKDNLKHELLLLAEKLYTQHFSGDASYVALMPHWVRYHDHKYKKKWFEKAVFKLFENIYLPVPACYDEVLKVEYGDYMYVHKGGGIHEYPLYGVQEAALIKTIGKNPFRFTLTKELVADKKRPSTLKDVCFEIIRMLYQAHIQIETLVVADDGETAFQVLTGCLEIAISLGTKLENLIGNCGTANEEISSDSKKLLETVHLLEEYCELLYNAGNVWETTSKTELDAKVYSIEAELKNYFENKHREVVFLPCRAEWWHTMEGMWEKECEDPNTSVYVLPVPYVIRDIYGDGTYSQCDDSSMFPKYVKVTMHTEYDIEKRHPDVIYIQNPYDEWSSTIDEPKFFYSKNLLNYTDELIYIPCFNVDDPLDQNDKAVAALKPFIEQPALLYADKVILQSEVLRRLYIEVLSDKSGGYKDYWEKKIIVVKSGSDVTNCDATNTNADRIFVIRVNIAFILEYRENAIDKINRTIDTIERLLQSDKKLKYVYSADEDVEQLSDIDSELWNEYVKVVDRIKQSSVVEYDEERSIDAEQKPNNIAAYYGNAGILANNCRNIGRPVMLMNADV